MADTNKRSSGVKNTDYVNYDWNGSGENTNYVNSIKEKFGAGQFFAKASIKMKMLADDSVSKSAEMIILGSTNGIVELGKLLRHTPEINPETMTLARDVIEYLEQIIEDMKYYL